MFVFVFCVFFFALEHYLNKTNDFRHLAKMCQQKFFRCGKFMQFRENSEKVLV